MDTDADGLSVLALTTSYPTSSADYRGRFVFEWALGLQALGASVRVIGPRSTSVAQGVPYHGFRHYPGLLMNTGAPETLQERKLWGTVVGAAVTVEMARMARARSKEGDLIVSHWLTPTAFAGLAAHRNNGCPVHAYAHGSDVALLEAIPRMVGQRLVRMLDRQLKGMTFVSGQLQDRFNELLGRTPRTRQTVLPMGFTQNEVDEDFLKDLRERAHGRPVISTLGRLVPIKGLTILAEALRSGPPCLWVAAGEGPERSALRTLIPDESQLFMPGAITPPMRESLFAISQIFIQPSLQLGQRQEGTPVSVVEAMAAGVPCILSDTGGLLQLAQEGQSLCVPGGDPVALSLAIQQLLSSPKQRQEMSEAHRRFASKYEWEQLSSQHLEVLMESVR